MARLVSAIRSFMSGLGLVLMIGGLVAAEGGDREELRKVFDDYVSGWREGDVDRLSQVFSAEEGRVMWVSEDGGRQALRSMTFADVLERRKAQPEYGLEWEVEGLDVIDGKLAVGKLKISRAGGSYIDILVCQKIEGRWRIVNKTFVTR